MIWQVIFKYALFVIIFVFEVFGWNILLGVGGYKMIIIMIIFRYSYQKFLTRW